MARTTQHLKSLNIRRAAVVVSTLLSVVVAGLALQRGGVTAAGSTTMLACPAMHVELVPAAGAVAVHVCGVLLVGSMPVSVQYDVVLRLTVESSAGGLPPTHR